MSVLVPGAFIMADGPKTEMFTHIKNGGIKTMKHNIFNLQLFDDGGQGGSGSQGGNTAGSGNGGQGNNNAGSNNTAELTASSRLRKLRTQEPREPRRQPSRPTSNSRA